MIQNITKIIRKKQKNSYDLYLLIMIDNLFLRPSVHFTTLHSTCRHFISSHLNFTQLHFTTLLFGLNPFKVPIAAFIVIFVFVFISPIPFLIFLVLKHLNHSSCTLCGTGTLSRKFRFGM